MTITDTETADTTELAAPTVMNAGADTPEMLRYAAEPIEQSTDSCDDGSTDLTVKLADPPSGEDSDDGIEPPAGSLLAELEARQDEVLEQLDALEKELMAVLATCTPQTEEPVAEDFEIDADQRELPIAA